VWLHEVKSKKIIYFNFSEIKSNNSDTLQSKFHDQKLWQLRIFSNLKSFSYG